MEKTSKVRSELFAALMAGRSRVASKTKLSPRLTLDGSEADVNSSDMPNVALSNDVPSCDMERGFENTYFKMYANHFFHSIISRTILITGIVQSF